MSVIDAINIPNKLSIIPRWMTKEVISTFHNYIYYDLYTHVNYEILFPYIYISNEKRPKLGEVLLCCTTLITFLWSHFGRKLYICR
jgi:hypothetical protein